jgi:hypothetical protein
LVEYEFKALFKDIPNDTIISCIDFLNYAFKTQNEVQDINLYNMQISILVHITNKIDQEYDVANPQSSQMLKEVHYYISDTKLTRSQVPY